MFYLLIQFTRFELQKYKKYEISPVFICNLLVLAPQYALDLK